MKKNKFIDPRPYMNRVFMDPEDPYGETEKIMEREARRKKNTQVGIACGLAATVAAVSVLYLVASDTPRRVRWKG